MRQGLTFAMALTFTAFLADKAGAVAGCTLPFAHAAGFGDTATASVDCGGGGGGGGGGGRTCPVAIPAPADAFICACKTVSKDPAQRCNGALPPDLCAQEIQTASSLGLLTADGVAYLQANGFCPIVPPGINQIIDFCPVGCFAADTEILTGASGDGAVSYAPASQFVPSDPVMALSDEASVDGIDLVSRTLDRVVYGPEDPPLFVFGLATGGTLRVTMHHPMVLSDGTIVEAASVPEGASFIGVNGDPVAVTSITREPATADVFNVQTNGDTQLGHVIIAQQVLVGDLKLQNQLASEQGLIDLRR